MGVSSTQVYEALKGIKIIDLNKTRKDVKRLNARTNRTSKYKSFQSVRDNVSSTRGKRLSGVFGKIANPTSNWKPVDSRLTRLYPKASKLVFKYMREHAPKGFTFDSITVNHNLKCKRHQDSKNAPASFITAVGDFTGGELMIENPKTKNRHKYITKNKFLVFNGKNYPHWNTPIHGDKFTLVAYNRHGSGRGDNHFFEPYYVK